ncbi:tol [Fusarium agapanthi]|uniref:Tol n=1 Tax=Fusarium agapanthi TaxID=1803897 RepID=A0A9P5B5H9_9HYPO|nr:tol [Fusarium agapanthi]
MTGSGASFRWAREIIEKCEREHHNCRNHFVRFASQRYLPKRLIDVQSRDKGVIQLLLSGQIRPEISVNMLRSVTAGEEESGDMGLVYARAKVVISATASKNSEGGCYKPKDLFPYDYVLCSTWTSSLVVRSSIKYPNLVQLFGEKVDCLMMFECNTLTTSEGHQEEEYPLNTQFSQNGTMNAPTVPHPGREPPKRLCNRTIIRRAGSSTRPVTRPARDTIRKSWYANPKHKLWADKKRRYDVQISSIRTNAARLSIRGAFSFLRSFRGQDMKEKAEFHLRWLQVRCWPLAREIALQSPLGGGFWGKKATARPVCSLVVLGSSVSDTWEHIESLVSDLKVQATHTVNGMAHDATLKLSCQLRTFGPLSLSYVYDTLEYHERREIRYLPVLKLVNRRVGLLTKTAQIHGILVREVSSTSCQAEGTRAQYMRVGYFCTERTNIQFQEMGREELQSIELL